MKRMRKYLLIPLSAAMVACGQHVRYDLSGYSDTAIYYGGDIVTVDDGRPEVEAVLVGDGRIVAVGGKRELIAPLSQQAMDLGFGGLIVEAHCSPDCAWSDKAQQVTPEALAYIIRNLTIREQTSTTENLNELRAQIDKLDDELLELLARRMRVSHEIGQYKKEHDMPVLQAQRYEELLARRAAQAVEMGMDREFMRTVMQAIHEESVRQQMQVLGK